MRNANLRQPSRKHSHTQHSQDGTNAVKLLDGFFRSYQEGSWLIGFDARDNPERQEEEKSPDDGEEDKAGTPVENTSCNSRRQTANGKTQRISGTEASKGPSLASAWDGVGGAKNTNGRRHDHGRGKAKDTAENVHPERV